jgi:hypothetical protein
MGWLTKKKDPIAEREQALKAEIEKLEVQIQELSGRLDQPQPRLRSTALPGGQSAPRNTPSKPSGPREQVFEELDHHRLQAPAEPAGKALYNDLGMRKYDLPGAWQRFKGFFRAGEPPTQPFVRLLAAGNIQGLKSLRYEKRIARRRFIWLAAGLFLVLWGLLYKLLHH